MDIFLRQIINGLVLSSIHALVALGYTMVYGIMSLNDFVHGEVVMVGTPVASSATSGLHGGYRPLRGSPSSATASW